MIHQSRLLRVLVLLVLMILPASFAAAQANDDDGSFVLQVNKPLSVAADEVVDSVMVIDDTVTVEGRIAESLWVINGDAVVNGEVAGDVTVFSGTLTLGPEATVDNVTLFRSDMTRAEGAIVSGDITDQAALTLGLSMFSVAFWIGTVIVTILVGLAFVALAGTHLDQAAETILAHRLETGVTGLATWIVLPVLAVITFVSLIGIPVGLAIVLVVIPALALLGYLVAAHLVGTSLASLAKVQVGRYLSVIVGVIALQLLGLVPWIGGLFVFLATMFGTGALVYQFYRNRRERRPVTTPAAPMGGAAHA